MAKWAKGMSGNPGGRPKGLGDIREIARQHTSEAVATLVNVMHNEKASDQARVHAATAILDRGWGRPALTVHAVDATPGVPPELVGVAHRLLEIHRERQSSDQPEITRETEAAPVVDADPKAETEACSPAMH